MTNQPQTNQPAITKKAAIYIRVASPQVSRHSADVRELHTEQLVAYAHQLGFTDETIVIFDDSDISAFVPLKKRGGMQAVLQALEQGEMTTLFLATEQSLFRNAQTIHVSVFVQFCREHNVHVVTPQFVYDFADPSHVLLFRMAVECLSFSMYARTRVGRRFQKLQQREE